MTHKPVDDRSVAPVDDMRLAVTALLEGLTVHQWNFNRRLGKFDLINTKVDALMTHDERLSRVEDQVIDTRLAVSALLDTVTQFQRNFEALTVEIRDIRTDMRGMQAEIRDVRTDMRDMQAEIRGLQVENHRILEILEQRLGE